MNLDFSQKVESAIAQLHKLANTALAGKYDVTLVFHRADLDEDQGGLVAGTGNNEDALSLLEENLSEDESDIVVRSR